MRRVWVLYWSIRVDGGNLAMRRTLVECTVPSGERQGHVGWGAGVDCDAIDAWDGGSHREYGRLPDMVRPWPQTVEADSGTVG